MAMGILDLILGQQQPGGILSGYERVRQDSGAAPVLAAGGPVGAFQPQMAPQAQPMPQRAPAGSGGGFGEALGGIFGNLLGLPDRSGEQETIDWLQGQGMDPGTASLVARDKQLLRSYIGERAFPEPPDPMDALNLQKTQLEIEQMRNPTTDDIREYQFAVQQGYQGTLPEFMQDIKKAGATSIQNIVGADTAPGLGKLSQDYGYVLDPETRQPVIDPETGLPQSAPVPGSPAALEAEAATRAEEAKGKKRERVTDIVTQDIDRALDIIDNSTLPTTGMIGEWLSGIGGTNARNLRGLVDTVKANAGFEQLQAMREASPTGGALGQVSERELAFLQSTIGNLEQSQTAEQLKDNLNRVWNVYQNIIHGEGNFQPRRLGFEQGRGSQDKPVSEMTDEELEAIINAD